MILKINNATIIVLFLLTITCPLVFSNKTGGELSTTENRYLASFPDILSDGGLMSSQNRMELENWIKDNIAGRSEAKKTYNLFSYVFFGVVPEKDIVQGKDNWLFLIPAYDIPNFTNSNLPSPEILESLKSGFIRLTNEFNSEGIEFTVMIWPYKYNVYPEYFINSLITVNPKSAVLYLDQQLSEDKRFDFKTPINTLIKNKSIYQTFYKAYDISHWNNYGAFLGYTELMMQAKRHIPDLKVLTTNDFVIEEVERLTKTSWGVVTTENDLNYQLIGGYHSTPDTLLFDLIDYKSKDPWKSYKHFINSNSNLPKAIIVGDSFTWMFLSKNIAESFSELVYIHVLDINNLPLLIEVIKPDIVMAAAQGLGKAAEFARYRYLDSELLYSRILSENTPKSVELGKIYNIEIVVTNDGNTTWSHANGDSLCIFVGGVDLGYRIELPVGLEIQPGDNHTFILMNFSTQWIEPVTLDYQMVREGTGFFGEKKHVEISVK